MKKRIGAAAAATAIAAFGFGVVGASTAHAAPALVAVKYKCPTTPGHYGPVFTVNTTAEAQAIVKSVYLSHGCVVVP